MIYPVVSEAGPIIIWLH